MKRFAQAMISAVLLPVVMALGACSGASRPAGASRSGAHTPRAATNAAPAPTEPAPTPTKAGTSQVSNETWMHDLGPHIWYRKLSQIVIPGSHDSGTYSIGDEPFGAYAQTQTEDFTSQLNDGARDFDIRARYWTFVDSDWFVRHGFVLSSDVKLSDIFDQILRWTLQPSHYHEVLMLSLGFDPNGGPGNNHAPQDYPAPDCFNFTRSLGSALLTPSEAQAHFGTTDPGQITPGQLWSLQGPDYGNGPPRVIIDNSECMNAFDPSYGHWSDTATSGGLFGGYYADQCYAGSYPSWHILPIHPGITEPTLNAVRVRAIQGGGDDDGHEVNLGPTKPGGLYDVGIEGTPTADCFFPLSWFDLNADKSVLSTLYDDWKTDPSIQANLNIISGDYIQETDLVSDVIAMDETYPIQADQIQRQGPDTVTGEQGQKFPAGFQASVTYQGQPVDQQQVTYQVTGPGFGMPTANGSSTATATSSSGVVNLDNLLATRPGTWTLTASLPNSTATATWTLDVTVPTNFTLRPAPDENNPTTVNAGNTTRTQEKHLPMSFYVQAVDERGDPVPGVKVTCDAAAAGGTFYPNGAKTATTTTSSNPGQPDDGDAKCPPFNAPTHAGSVSILVWSPGSVTSPGAPTLGLPLTVVPGDEQFFVPLTGNEQSTPIGTTFAVPLTGHFTDYWGNVLTRADLERACNNCAPPYIEVHGMGSNPPDATWADGSTSWTVPTSALAPDGTLTAPPLRAGDKVRPNTSPPDKSGLRLDGVNVLVSSLPHPWTLAVTPGPVAAVAAGGGDDQHTEPGKPFAHPLAAKVTDSGGNPIPGVAVTFAVTSGQAVFPAPNLHALAEVRGDVPPQPNTPNPPRTTVVVSTDANGVATAPVLTAGAQSGPIVISASASGVPAAKTAVFHLSSSGTAPTAPTITNLGNGDGQATVGFSGAVAGTSPITSYEVSATDVDNPGPPVTASGPSSPITVKGLTNGQTYTFTVTAISADGTSPPSVPSGRLNVGVGPVVTSEPADTGTVGQIYSSGFTVTGAPPPAVTLHSGELPPGLTLADDGELTGTPTQAGSYDFTVQVQNDVGQLAKTVAITISP